ncbi:uncharacterized protein TRIREDRAFT_103364 [Trichoderma reesei QM6a]|jgi:hypothetical protein|uniref:Predicted protein n=2 Tax=Hypocrea jecorina TaxID=51453 RepID=G0R7U9_HYPJQ|nr:uncharacterized protein TRIREDRAFT_103364 [Trichoderma reesei QM6a]EGR53128.1 predicted protein [Trichoderma reesei QM6a]ETR99890.1 hypothetical protein M419DRAFT_84871 [Trichoderma reesei RUT C-30]
MAPPKNPRKPQRGKEDNDTSRKGREKKEQQPKSHKSIKKSKGERQRERELEREVAQKQREERIILERARLHNGLELELPEEQDFAHYSAVPQRSYYLKIRQLRQELNNKNDDPPQPQSHMAPAPWVPSPYDDISPRRPYSAGDDYEQEDEQVESQGRPRKRACARSKVPAKRQRCNKKAAPLSQEFILTEDKESDEEEVHIPEHIIRKTPPTFMGIPREIRMQIYRSLLTAAEPIQVFGGWKQLYWKEDLRLSTGILRVCKSVYEEACTVLYGANTFLYLLRDPSSETDDIDDLATDDSPQAEEEDLNDDDGGDLDYEEDGISKRPARPAKERTINIAKYAHLFRKINIKAEANRYSGVTLEGMAAAINVFARKAAQDGTGWDTQSRLFIHTLTVSVSPTSNQRGKKSQEAAAADFTFVNFFVPGSPVLSAIKAVDCQLLRIDILTSETRRGKTCSMSGSRSCRLEFNRTYERICAADDRKQMVVDSGHDDDGVNNKRLFARGRVMKLARLSEKRIDELAKHVALFCEQRGFGQRTTEDMDVDSPYWNDSEDDYEEEEDEF